MTSRRPTTKRVVRDLVDWRTGKRKLDRQRRAEMQAILPTRAIVAQWPEPAKAALIAYAQFGIQKLAAVAAGVSAAQIQRYRRNHPSFRRAWLKARSLAADTMEAVAYDRAMYGTPTEVYYKGELVGYKHIPSDLLMMFMLKGLRPSKYKERVETEHRGDALGLKALAKLVDRMDGDRDQMLVGSQHDIDAVDVVEVEVVDAEATGDGDEASTAEVEANTEGGERKAKGDKKPGKAKKKSRTKG